MVAAPQYATFTFRGMLSGQTYSVDAYLSDVVAALVNFDGGGGAGATSPTYWRPPEPVRLEDFSIPTGMTDTKFIQLTKQGSTTGDSLRYPNFLNSLATRKPLNVLFPANADFGAIQR